LIKRTKIVNCTSKNLTKTREQRILEDISDKNSILNLFKELNYKVDPIDEDIQLPDSAIRLLETPLTLISD
jgi:hypothetical protein